MKGTIQKINDNWMVVLDQRTWQDPSAEDLIIPLHIDDLWVIDHTGYVLGKNQELDFEITTVEEGVTDCGTHIIYNDYAKVIRRPTKKEAMTPSEILMKHENANEYHFHEVDRKWIIEAMEEFAKTRSEKLDILARLLAKSWFYGKWEWENPNERVMQMIMQELGYYPFKNEDKMIRETRVDEDLYKQAVEQIKTR